MHRRKVRATAASLSAAALLIGDVGSTRTAKSVAQGGMRTAAASHTRDNASEGDGKHDQTGVVLELDQEQAVKKAVSGIARQTGGYSSGHR